MSSYEIPVELRIKMEERRRLSELERAAESKHAGYVRELKMVNVIRLEVTVGKGLESDPLRVAVEWWTTEGRLLLREDPWIPPKPND